MWCYVVGCGKLKIICLSFRSIITSGTGKSNMFEGIAIWSPNNGLLGGWDTQLQINIWHWAGWEVNYKQLRLCRVFLCPNVWGKHPLISLLMFLIYSRWRQLFNGKHGWEAILTQVYGIQYTGIQYLVQDHSPISSDQGVMMISLPFAGVEYQTS